MRPTACICALVLGAVPACSPGAQPQTATVAPPGVGAAAWARLGQALPGTWTMPGKSGPFTVSYRFVSNGSALVETWGVGSPHETLTVFHPDHDDVVLTHYCAQGNQPRLRVASVSADSIVFRFADATNVGPDQAVLVERTLRLSPDAFEDTETYRGADGKPDTTTYRFTRAAAATGP